MDVVKEEAISANMQAYICHGGVVVGGVEVGGWGFCSWALREEAKQEKGPICSYSGR